MEAAAVPVLIAAVRRRLWRLRSAAVARRAAWASAALALMVAAVHLLVVPLTLPVLGAALLLAWSWAVAAGIRCRPTDRDCALWADRHAGGASAISTWLDVGLARPGSAPLQAVRRFQAWLDPRIPDCLAAVRARPAPTRLTGPLVAMSVAMALAVGALSVTTPVPPSPAGVAAAAPATPAPRGETVADMAAEVTAALRSAAPADPALPRSVERRAAAAPGAAPAPAAGAGAAASGTPPTAPGTTRLADATALAAVQSESGAPQTASGTATAPGVGREAGDSRDARGGAPESSAPAGLPSVPRSAVPLAESAADGVADMDRAAAVVDGMAMPSAGPAPRPSVAPPAEPPPAVASARLSPTETRYVQAWMNALHRRP